ncbi:MAG: carbohydrate ABC transporter substrate-binding protein [Oscillospiraceae bacterium]
MKKRLLAALLASAAVLSFAGCSSNTTSSTPAADNNSSTPAADAGDAGASDAGDAGDASDAGDTSTPEATKVSLPAPVAASDEAKKAGTGITVSESEGKVFNIYAWNEEFKGFFEKYYTVPEGIEVKWTINPSDDGVYQDKLDQALKAQASAAADDKVDMFLAEADYIIKYVNSDYTMDISKLGVNYYDTEYEYTVSAAMDTRNGAIKGVSFQCCPAALIYRRSIAEDVLGTSEPAEVQAKLSDWTKFNEVAKTAKEKGYYMTASYVETFRTFSNNTTGPWVDADNNLVIDSAFEDWMTQTEDFLKNEYTLTSGVWGDEKNAQMFKDGKTMCFFGPAWYYNFCMGNAMDPENGCSGDWAIVQGPQAFFWGGTWLLAAEGSDNPEMLADIFNAFTANEDICSKLVENEMQFTNNMAVNQKFADDPDYGNAFLGGQNDTAIFVELAKNIKFENKTIYDQLLSEKFPEYMLDYFTGAIDKETALSNFYSFVNEKYPAIVTP